MRPGETTLRHLLAPIADWLAAPGVTEICVNHPGGFFLEMDGVWHDMKSPELTIDRLLAIGVLAAAMTGQDIGPSRPICSTRLPDGQRIQVCIPPAVSEGVVSLTIRQPPRFKATMDSLSDRGMFQVRGRSHAAASSMEEAYALKDWKSFLSDAVLQHKNILVAGATGSGKTTTASAMIRTIPTEERLVTIEDTPEWIDLPHQNRVALFYSKGDQGAAKVSSEELLEASLRMRPDRVLMQELRDGAAFTYLRSVAAGHPGSITTCHAGSAEGAFDALRLMVRQHPAGQTLGDADVRDLLRQMVDVVVHCERQGGSYGISDIWWKEANNEKSNH